MCTEQSTGDENVGIMKLKLYVHGSLYLLTGVDMACGLRRYKGCGDIYIIMCFGTKQMHGVLIMINAHIMRFVCA